MMQVLYGDEFTTWEQSLNPNYSYELGVSQGIWLKSSKHTFRTMSNGTHYLKGIFYRYICI